jgi:hypothetical protein
MGPGSLSWARCHRGGIVRLRFPMKREMPHGNAIVTTATRTMEQGQTCWPEGAPFKPKEIWAIRIRLQMEERTRELALFNLGIDSKLRGCDLTSMRVRDVCQGERVAARACVLQRKPNDQYNSRSRHRLARLSKPGSARLICRPRITCSRAVVETRHISALVSTPVSCTAGSSS